MILRVNVLPRLIEGKPVRTVLRWQLYATAASMLIAAFWSGSHGALSALSGGLINVIAGAASGLIATYSLKRTVGEALRGLMRAEAGKILLIVVQLWAVLTFYRGVVLAAFFGTFFLTVIFSSMAIFVREHDRRQA